MLVLTRRIGQALMIGDDVKITVLALRGNQVKIGIRAPSIVAVHREEVFERIQQELDPSESTELTAPVSA